MSQLSDMCVASSTVSHFHESKTQLLKSDLDYKWPYYNSPRNAKGFKLSKEELENEQDRICTSTSVLATLAYCLSCNYLRKGAFTPNYPLH
jgi:hypothetical protein